MAFTDIEKFSNLLDDFAAYYSNEYKRTIAKKEVYNAIFLLIADIKYLTWAGDLWNVEMSEAELKALLDKFDFEILNKTIETDNEIFPMHVLIQRRVLIKDNGLIWIIHKNDKDPFPSIPHAHCLDQNLKLDLGNGNYFRNRELLGRLKKKELISIREKASKVFQGDLPPMN